ncbi:MAG: hypothetical protein PHV98_00870 [Candidatus Omnitrophica bacterium]|nr:hypothetical protein [Candidatus Omnitrophota bacterium]
MKKQQKITIIADYKPDGANHFFDIDDLPFTAEAKCMVLEWFARKLWVLLEEGSDDPDYYCKMYDPLTIEGNIAHSYVFNFEDGGRHHPFSNLIQLEKMLMDEGIKTIQAMRKYKE